MKNQIDPKNIAVSNRPIQSELYYFMDFLKKEINLTNGDEISHLFANLPYYIGEYMKDWTPDENPNLGIPE